VAFDFGALSGVLSVGSSIGSAVTSIFAGKAEARSQAAMGRLEQSVQESNARLAEMNADDAIRRGTEAQALLGKQGRQFIGRQRAGFAAQGVVVGKGSAAEVVASTRAEIGEDLRTIQNNAWLEAWGFKYEAVQSRFQGQVSRITRANAAKSSLIAGGLQAASALTRGAHTAFGLLPPGTSSTSLAAPTFQRPSGGSHGAIGGPTRGRHAAFDA